MKSVQKNISEISNETLLQIIENKSSTSVHLWEVAKNNSVTEEMLLKVLNHPSVDDIVLGILADNKNSTDKVFSGVLAHMAANIGTLCYVANNDNATESILCEVYNHRLRKLFVDTSAPKQYYYHNDSTYAQCKVRVLLAIIKNIVTKNENDTSYDKRALQTRLNLLEAVDNSLSEFHLGLKKQEYKYEDKYKELKNAKKIITDNLKKLSSIPRTKYLKMS